MKNLVVLLERNLEEERSGLRICGTIAGSVAHKHGVPHGAVQVAVVVSKRIQSGKVSPHILLHRRSMHKAICPGTWDICGGHVDADTALIDGKDKWDDMQYIEQLFMKTAIREVNEECRINPERAARPFKFRRRNLKRFGDVGFFQSGFETPVARNENREYGTFFAAFIPRDVVTLEASETAEETFEVVDTIPSRCGESQDRSPELDLVTLHELLNRFSRNRSDYADGVARVFLRLMNEQATMNALEEFLRPGDEKTK